MRVVCVDDRPVEDFKGVFSKLLTKGKIYTVRKYGDYFYSNCGVFPSFWLLEVRRINDWPFGSDRFRPIDESKIDCLREHLTKVPKSVKEDA